MDPAVPGEERTLAGQQGDRPGKILSVFSSPSQAAVNGKVMMPVVALPGAMATGV
jgi:hypothetical protein